MRTKSWKRTTALVSCSVLLAATAASGLAALPARAAAATRYTVDLEKQLQEFDGWGLSLSWWATEIGDWTRQGSSGKEKREEIAEALYGKSGLNLNIARYNVGGGDDPTHTHMSDDRNTPGWRSATKTTEKDPSGHDYTQTVLDDYVWVGENGETIPWTELKDVDTRNDYRQLWVLDWIQNEHGADGQNDYISEYYSNSPPYWMTMSGCSSGGAGAGQNLDPMYNQDFVDYFLDVYEYLTGQGFILENLQPFNESGSYFWGVNGDQEGCYFSPQQKVQILDLLRKGMEERGIDAVYNWGDETNTDVAWQQYGTATSYNTTDSEGEPVSGADVVRGASRYTYHIYSYDIGGAQRFYRAAQADGKEIYMSEICWSDSADSGEAEYDPNSVTTGLHYTQSIIDTVKHGGVNAYVFWQGMEDMVGQMKGGTNYGLIQGVYYNQEEAEAQGVDLASMGLTYQDYVLSKAYYMSGQYTKYIRQGYHLVDVNENNTLAAISPDGETLVVVKQNNSGSGETFGLDLDGFKASSVEKIYTDKTHNWTHQMLSTNGDSVEDTVSDYSVTTYVIHGQSQKGAGYFVDESAMQSKANLDAIKSDLEEGGETEQFYQTGFSANGGDGKYYGQTSYAQNGYLAYRFQGTGIALSFLAKSDSGAIEIYIDGDPEADEPTATVDLYSATKTPGKIVYRNNTLEEGWHTIYIKTAAGAHGSWSNLDGAFIYTSHDLDASEQELVISDAVGFNGEVKFNYTATGLDDFTFSAEIYENGAWGKVAGAYVTDGQGSFTTEADSVRMRLVAEKGSDKVISPESIVEVRAITAEEGVLYFVDCGTSDPNTLSHGAVLGTLQSVSDKPYGEDPFTKYSWGYVGTFSEAYYAPDEAMSSMWPLEKLKDAGGTAASAIEYKFTIPEAGDYKVALGFFGGEDGWGERTVKVTIGEKTENATLKENEYTGLFFTLTTTEEAKEITVKVEHVDGGSALVSLIAITEADVQLPLYTTGASDLSQYADVREDIYIGEDIYGKIAEETFELYYSNGLHKKLENAKVSVQLTIISINQTAKAVLDFEADGIECFHNYRWMQEGGSQLYYNIDCGYIQDGGTPPDDGTELGIKQSTTHDRQFGEDSGSGTSWGYVGSNYNDGVNWHDDKENKWSIREGKDGSGNKKYVEYKMTGFKPDEPLRIEVAGHCSNWGTREYDVLVNSTKVGTVMLIKNANPITVPFEGENVKADASGELVVRCQQNVGDGAQVGFIKVYSTAPDLPLDTQITADKTEIARDDTVTLSGLNTNATVYIYDENDVMTGSFKPKAESQEIQVKDYLPETSYELHLTQAYANGEEGTNPSPELVLSAGTPEGTFDVEIVKGTEFVKDGDCSVVTFAPVVPEGVGIMSLTLTTPDGVNYNLLENFFFRATLNGEYKVTLVPTAGSKFEKTFTIENIDAVDFHAEYSTEDWTNESVTVTFAPTAKSGVSSVEIDGTPATATEGKYSFTATENGTHTVKVTTAAGFEYERTFEVGNIDKAAPALDINIELTAAGLVVNYEAIAASGGKLYADFNGTAREITEEHAFTLDEAGKYEIYFKNGLGQTTEKLVYYVTFGAENANLASVSVGADGLVTATAKARDGFEAKLFRAGEEEAIESMKAEKAGKYYLDIESGGEHEVIVLYVQSPALGGGTGSSDIIGTGAGGGADAGMIAGIVIGVAAIVAAAVVCTLIIVKRRKNA